MGTCPPPPPSLCGLSVSWLWVCNGWSSVIRPLCVWEAPLSLSGVHLVLAAGVMAQTVAINQPRIHVVNRKRPSKENTPQLHGNSTLHQFNHRFHIYQVLSGNYLKLLSLIRFYSGRPIQISLHLERDILRVGPLL